MGRAILVACCLTAAPACPGAPPQTPVQGPLAPDNPEYSTMAAHPQFEVVATLPWGEGPDEIPQVLMDHPPFSEYAPGQLRKVRRPLRLRCDAWGGLHILVDPGPAPGATFIQHLGPHGDPLGRTLLGSADPGHRVLDFAVDGEGGSYVLGEAAPGIRRLRKVSPGGATGWANAWPMADGASGPLINPARLFLGNDARLYLPDAQGTGAIAEIDPANGALMRVHRSGQNSGNAFVNAHRLAVYVLYFQELNRRGLGWFDLNDQGFRSWVGGKDLYGWLLTPIGVDGRGNLYTWKDSALARIDPQGGVEVLASLDNLVPGADGSLYGSRFEAGQGMATVWVKAHGSREAAPELALRLPTGLAADAGGAWRLIGVDAQGLYWVFGGEAPGQVGTLLAYTGEGQLAETRSPPLDLLGLESILADHRFWDLDPSGRVYLPVAAPAGLWVVRITPEPSDHAPSEPGMIRSTLSD